jgi:omega-6 fatty acid desaturase (delta-12 desaturase)
VSETNVGSFPLLSTEMWRAASPGKRLAYRASRSPLIILFAWVTVFLYSICWTAFASKPRKHWDSALAIVVNIGIVLALWLLAGPAVLFFAFVLPLFVSSALGAYLFYAQHNVVGMRILDPERWTYHEAALASSSFMKLGPLMRRFTGNIGYHHVHHLNPLIPFYRLPEAMAAIPELQTPVVTTLHPRDVIASLRLKLWDRAGERMVGYREAHEAPVSGT